MIEAAKAGGSVLKRYFGDSLETTQKSTVADFRTKADLESEAAILQVLRTHFPNYNYHAEEEGKTENGSGYTFIIDPLDGTANFVTGLSNFCVSIGLLKGEEIVAGVIYMPVLDRVYRAEKGHGSLCNDTPIRVNGEQDITRASVGHLCSYTTEYPAIEKMIHGLFAKDVKRLMMSWCPTYDYCLLASGKIEAIINDGPEIYDFAAGKVIMSEAGGKMSDFSGNESSDGNRFFLVSNGTQIHQEILDAIQ